MLAETAVPLNHVLGRKPVQLTLDHGTLTVTVIAVPEPGAGLEPKVGRDRPSVAADPCCRHVVRDRGLHVGIAAAGEDRRPCAPTGCADLDLLNDHDVPKFDVLNVSRKNKGATSANSTTTAPRRLERLQFKKRETIMGFLQSRTKAASTAIVRNCRERLCGGASIGPLEITNAKIRTASLTTSNGSGAVRLGLATADCASVQL